MIELLPVMLLSIALDSTFLALTLWEAQLLINVKIFFSLVLGQVWRMPSLGTRTFRHCQQVNMSIITLSNILRHFRATCCYVWQALVRSLTSSSVPVLIKLDILLEWDAVCGEWSLCRFV